MLGSSRKTSKPPIAESQALTIVTQSVRVLDVGSAFVFCLQYNINSQSLSVKRESGEKAMIDSLEIFVEGTLGLKALDSQPV